MTAMDHVAFEKALVDWVATTGLPREAITFAGQKAPLPTASYACITIEGTTPRAPVPEERFDPATGVLEHYLPHRMTVFVEFYTTTNRPDTDALALAETAMANAALLSVRDSLATAGMTVMHFGRLHAINVQVANVWQRQAKFATFFRVTSSVSENVGTIQHVIVASPDLGIPPTTIDSA